MWAKKRRYSDAAYSILLKVNGIASLLLVPIRNPKAPSIVIGFLSFTSNVPREWTPGDMVLLEMARDLVSATLCHPDIFINLDHEIAHLSATEVEARLSDEQHATVDRIVVLFEKMRRQSKIKDLWVSLGMSAFKYKLARFIISNQTIAMALPAFPFKSRNTNSNVIGTLPDMGEALALANLNSFALQVSEVYPPGCKILVKKKDYYMLCTIQTFVTIIVVDVYAAIDDSVKILKYDRLRVSSRFEFGLFR
ncbi:unnamed protein product [Rotaria magnacalcarata]|uniref:Uncharacterized protein n=1 Tax=Rotaria magnacalcarata TaxID=392030 RepID=A0A8S2U776_9BILA|nr:unnamed protein product [Rotaria magnacalcarata]CAF4117553.1 unnamed protein product [Rotaria magnacalcarata]CAF4319133.1 unnamed protein product [Rotaria magnacalcarata]